jgi:hypothetical protein
MRLKWIRCSRWPCAALIALIVGGSGTAECAAKRKKANMSTENAKKEVTGHLEAFRKSGELTELRNAANLIERIEVHTAPSFEDRESARTAKLTLWLKLLDTIDSAKDPTFDPADVPAARVTLPPGTRMKPGVPVDTPEGIADPADRRKYDDAVKANADKTKRYRFQKELRQLDGELTSRADAYISSTNLKSAQSVKEMDEAVTAQIHNQDRAAHLRSLVAP